MSDKLENLGFKVEQLLNSKYTEMHDTFENISRDLSSEDVFLLYFSGHGYMSEGKNYLIPGQCEHKSNHVCLEGMIKRLGQRNGGKNIFILDCCRVDPTDDTYKGDVSYQSEIKSLDFPIEKKAEFFFMFASDPGQVAYENSTFGGYYTLALLQYINQGEEIYHAAVKTGQSVKLSKPNQRTWVQSSFRSLWHF